MQVTIGNAEVLRRVAERLQNGLESILNYFPNEYKETDFPSKLIQQQGVLIGLTSIIKSTGRNYRIIVEILNEDKTVMDLNNLQTSSF